MVMRLQRCSCIDHRLVASARQLRSSRCERVSKTTGGLRPPALALRCERLPAEKRFLRCTNAHPTKSGERQPAVGWIAPRGQCTANYVPPITTVEPRAANVSPPWYGNAIAAVFVHRPPTGRLCVTIAIQPAASVFPKPRGAYAPRSCAAMRTSAGEKRFLRCTNAHPTKSGGRQAAVVPIRACNGDRFLRTDYVSPRTVASRTTAGSRQPLLGQRPVPVIDDYSPVIVRLAHAVD
jgi:hypothetical protein